MSQIEKQSDQKIQKDSEEDLPVPWKKIQSAIWLVGLAILFWKGWWWPGILILAAISGLFQGLVQLYLERNKTQKEAQVQEQALTQERAAWLPAVCPKCGGPLSVSTVRWTGLNTGDCPYCSANLKP
jgi:membrane protein implicated in regulation of membrane protease activity